MPCETPKTIEISHEAQHSSAGNSQSCSSADGFRKEGEHVGITQCVRPEGCASVIDRELTQTEPSLEGCGDARTAHDAQLEPSTCGTIDTESNAASHANTATDGLAAAADNTSSSAFDSPTSKAQDESQTVSQTDHYYHSDSET